MMNSFNTQVQVEERNATQVDPAEWDAAFSELEGWEDAELCEWEEFGERMASYQDAIFDSGEYPY